MITYQVTIWCDGKSCRQGIDDVPANQPDAHLALSRALNDGWQIKAGKHLCPKCAVKQKP